VVTHDVIEAVTLANFVLVMHDGKVRQQGSVEEVFSRPVDSAVARIVGVETVIRGRVMEVRDGLARVAVGAANIFVVSDAPRGSDVDLCIRAQDVAIVADASASTSVRNRLSGRIVQLVWEGALARVVLDCGFRLTALVTREAAQELQLREGCMVTASLKATAIHVVTRIASE
jgi:molybdate transport system ATP-binding protein